MAETRVDLLHLLEDLRDAYPGALEETILTEILANALDSGASLIRIQTDSANTSLTIVDNGSGMPRHELRRYHDLATSSKKRGQGIGFAGVGIKLALLACKEVVTETRRGKVHVASQWHLAARHKAPWRWTPPPGLVSERGTAIQLRLSDAFSPLTDAGYVEAAVRRHFLPLLDPAFNAMMLAVHGREIVFEVNGRQLEKIACTAAETSPLEIYMGRKRTPQAYGYLYREALPLPDDRRGIAISTYGKIIRAGWDWLGVTPAAAERIGGVIEVPALAASLTLNKGDFVRTGARGAAYLAYRKAAQEAVMRQLAAWGDGGEQAEPARPRGMRSLERDLERVLLDLSAGFPLLAALVEHRRGGQKRLPLGPKSPDGEPGLATATVTPVTTDTDVATSAPGGGGHGGAPPPEENVPASPPGHATDLPDAPRKPRPSRLGLGVQFEERPDDRELGRLVESTVFINRAHPAYQRAAASRAEGYHIALTMALALAPLTVEPRAEHGFITEFMAHWGAAVAKPAKRRGKG
ncbi:MAG: ATP-binding protein [Burkholderiales bacterium]|nr:ATP-binding protein [Burkholderiales bacterium]